MMAKKPFLQKECAVDKIGIKNSQTDLCDINFFIIYLIYGYIRSIHSIK